MEGEDGFLRKLDEWWKEVMRRLLRRWCFRILVRYRGIAAVSEIVVGV